MKHLQANKYYYFKVQITKSDVKSNPFRGKVADDWIENIKLMNDKNKSTSLLEQNNAYIKSYEQKLKDADTLKSSDF